MTANQLLHPKNLILSSLILVISLFLSETNAQPAPSPLSLPTSSQIYCSSMCASYVDACYGPTSNQCYACDQKMFVLDSENGVCQSLTQNTVIFHELKSQSMSIEGYQTNQPTVTACGSYPLSGAYVAGHYIAKNFKIPQSYGGHYQLVVKFGIGYIGAWSTADTMNLQLNGQNYHWKYSCSNPTQQCSSSSIDCFKLISYTVKHDGDDLAFNLSSSISTTDPDIKYWGLRELIIVMKTCATNCNQCFGALESQCLSCNEGYYLLGNTCVKNCPFLKVEQSHYCVQSCPQGFYKDGTSCQVCSSSCLTCNNAETCIINIDGSTSEPFIQKNLLSFIILILLGVLLLAFIIYTLIIKRHQKKIQDSSSDDNNGINDKIIDAEIITRSDNKKDKKSKKEIKGETNQSVVVEQNLYSSYPYQFNQKSLDTFAIKDGEVIVDSMAELSMPKQLNEKIAPRKKRNPKLKKSQVINSPNSIQIKKQKDQLDEYYNKQMQFDNSKL